MALTRISTPWAQAEDWDEYRSIITDLYVKQERKMRDVMRIMTEEYGFYATRRMYKTRFKKWGLAKNINSKPACLNNVRPAHASGHIATTTGTYPKGGFRQITNYDSVPILQDLCTPSAVLIMAPPDCYKFAEATFHSTQVYFNSVGFQSLGLSASEKRLETATACAEWLDRVITAKTLLTLGYFRHAVKLIDICCHQYRSLLVSQDSSLMAVTINSVLKVLRYWPGLAKVFLDFICKMSQTVLGTYHPLSMVFQKLEEAGMGHLAYCLYTTLRQFLGGIVHIMPHPMMESYGDFIGDMVHGKVHDANTMQVELQSLQDRLQHHTQRYLTRRSDSPENTAAIQCRIASLHYYGKRYEDATKWALRLLNESLFNAHVATGCYDILHDIAVAENKSDLALENVRKAVETSVEAYGHVHCSTVRKVARLDSCLRRMGRLQEADKVKSDFEVQLTRICEDTRGLRL
ncbi:Clr5 domain-containing protein [Nemania abortiva]|nr:Clr5 domain-containing protein [Nemania abortiva]